MPQTLSHLNQPVKNHVVLELVGGAQGGCGPDLWDFVRILPDGGISQGFFRVPKGKMLVITDVDWQYDTAGLFQTSEMQILRLMIENIQNPVQMTRRVFESTVMLARNGTGMAGGASVSMTCGFLVSPAARICPDIMPGPARGPQGGGLSHLMLRGYLIP